MTEREAIAHWHEAQAWKQDRLAERQRAKGNGFIADAAENVAAFHRRSAASIRRGAGGEFSVPGLDALTKDEVEALLAAAGNVDPSMFTDDDVDGDRLYEAWISGRKKLGRYLDVALESGTSGSSGQNSGNRR